MCKRRPPTVVRLSKTAVSQMLHRCAHPCRYGGLLRIIQFRADRNFHAICSFLRSGREAASTRDHSLLLEDADVVLEVFGFCAGVAVGVVDDPEKS